MTADKWGRRIPEMGRANGLPVGVQSFTRECCKKKKKRDTDRPPRETDRPMRSILGVEFLSAGGYSCRSRQFKQFAAL